MPAGRPPPPSPCRKRRPRRGAHHPAPRPRPGALLPPRMRPAAAPPVQAAIPPPSPGLEFSDIWHPYRAVKKGLNWAGDQVPVIGGANEVRPTEPPPAILAPAPVSDVKPAPPA